MPGYQKVFDKDGKEIPDRIRVDGVIYKKVVSNEFRGCDPCDCIVNGGWCKVGGANCNINGYNEYYKVLDESQRVRPQGVYKINGKWYLAQTGRCKTCEFFDPLDKNYNCSLKGLSCQGHIPLKEIKKGGI